MYHFPSYMYNRITYYIKITVLLYVVKYNLLHPRLVAVASSASFRRLRSGGGGGAKSASGGHCIACKIRERGQMSGLSEFEICECVFACVCVCV